MNSFEAGIISVNEIILNTFCNAQVGIKDNFFRGIFDFPLSVKNFKNEVGELANFDYTLTMLTKDVRSAIIGKRTKLEIKLDSGEVFNLFVINSPEHDGDGMSEMQLGAINEENRRIHIRY